MNYVLDVHTHTLASGHAYSTLREMAKSASEKKIKLLGITEHAVNMPGTCSAFYFENLKMVDREMYGVELLLGTELNILDSRGMIDMDEKTLKKMDISIASLHTPCMKPGTKEEHTQAYLQVMKNPYVNIIGHPDDSRFPVDYEALVMGAKVTGTLLEVNNSSLDSRSFRQGAHENLQIMLRLCSKYRVPVVMNSDAHIDTQVGCREFSQQLIEELRFPQELIVNRSLKELKKYVNKYKF